MRFARFTPLLEAAGVCLTWNPVSSPVVRTLGANSLIFSDVNCQGAKKFALQMDSTAIHTMVLPIVYSVCRKLGNLVYCYM